MKKCVEELVNLINMGSLTIVENSEDTKDSNIVDAFE